MAYMAKREKDINDLSLLIDQARLLALELQQSIAAYLLSMASLEISERIEGAEHRHPSNKTS
jgi:hypothetical protein